MDPCCEDQRVLRITSPSRGSVAFPYPLTCLSGDRKHERCLLCTAAARTQSKPATVTGQIPCPVPRLLLLPSHMKRCKKVAGDQLVRALALQTEDSRWCTLCCCCCCVPRCPVDTSSRRSQHVHAPWVLSRSYNIFTTMCPHAHTGAQDV